MHVKDIVHFKVMSRRQSKQHDAAIAKAEELRNQYKAMQDEMQTSTEKLTRAGVGATAGGAAGGALSHLYGKLRGRDSIRRDLIAALGGATVGGVAGLASANQQPDVIKEMA